MVAFLNRWYWLWLTLCVTVGLLLGLFLPSRACAQVQVYRNPIYPTVVHDCIMAGRYDCLKYGKSPKEAFVADQTRQGITRQAALRSWSLIGTGKSKTYRCKPDGKDFTCERE